MTDFWATPRPWYHQDTYVSDEEARRLYDLADSCDLRSCLDIGCGDPRRGQRILRGAEFLDSVDLHPHHKGVIQGDVRTYSGGPYTTVLCCRVLCNVPEADRPAAIENLAALVQEGGTLLLADGWAESRRRSQQWRKARGWPELPPSSSGSTELEDSLKSELGKYFAWGEVLLPAADYMLWTRRDQKVLLPMDDLRRYAFPRYSHQERLAFSWPRIWELQRCAR
jgi:hypothetical protein